MKQQPRQSDSKKRKSSTSGDFKSKRKLETTPCNGFKVPTEPDASGHWHGDIILARRSATQRRNYDFLISWHGFDTSAWTWEPMSNLNLSGPILSDFVNHIPEPTFSEKSALCCRIQARQPSCVARPGFDHCPPLHSSISNATLLTVTNRIISCAF